MADLIPLWSSFIPPGADEAVRQVVASGWINTGKQEKAFRQALCDRFGFAHCIATNSCTSSMRACLAMLGIGRGDEVITTPWTFLATNTVILEQQATPVFADIDPATLNLDPAQVRKRITPRTRAILCVHFAGCPCDLEALRSISQETGIPLIEDCAHALGSRYAGRPIGADSELACFSFQAVKMITCGDGGAIASSRADYAQALKRRIWFGVDREQRPPSLIERFPDDLDELGFKYNLNDIAATLGLAGLQHLELALERRRRVAELYRAALAETKQVRLFTPPAGVELNHQLFPIRVDDPEGFIRHMAAQGVQTAVHNRRNDRYPLLGGCRDDLPHTAQADREVVLLPIHAELSPAQAQTVVTAVTAYRS